MRSWTIRAALPVFVLGCLAGVRAQAPMQPDGLEGAAKGIRPAFEQRYPPERTYAVAVRGDLPTLELHGRESGYPVEIVDTEWKGPGSMFRGKPVGSLAVGGVLRV